MSTGTWVRWIMTSAWIAFAGGMPGAAEATESVLLEENFSSGLPLSWTLEDEGDSTVAERGITASWYLVPEGWSGAPSLHVGGDLLYPGFEFGVERMDESVITPIVDPSDMDELYLDLEHTFWGLGIFTRIDQRGMVDVRSAVTAGEWVNLHTFEREWIFAEVFTLDLTDYAASDLQLRFRFESGPEPTHWQLHSVRVRGTICEDPDDCGFCESGTLHPEVEARKVIVGRSTFIEARGLELADIDPLSDSTQLIIQSGDESVFSRFLQQPATAPNWKARLRHGEATRWVYRGASGNLRALKLSVRDDGLKLATRIGRTLSINPESEIRLLLRVETGANAQCWSVKAPPCVQKPNGKMICR